MIALAVVASSCGHHVQPQVHLIPAGYSGHVIILHGIADGAPARREGPALQWRVYEIPATGVLRTQDVAEHGWSRADEVRHYFVHPDGSRTPIGTQWDGTIADTPANRSDPAIGVLAGGTGTWGSVEFSHYAVGTKAQILDAGSVHDIGRYLESRRPMRP